MIKFIKINDSEPYREFTNLYHKALSKNQKNIEAASISSFNSISKEVEARFVNLKYINNNEWIFFSNYKSTKAKDFKSHNQISALFYWNELNVQIRIKAKIERTSPDFSDQHFIDRSDKKNALAISSNQSEIIKSYENIVENYEKILSDKNNLIQRPGYWGGYSFTPYYFEFWEGHESRLNKRDVYKLNNGDWNHRILQP
jgi:pyridoxamine 5'-phosphate oxidase